MISVRMFVTLFFAVFNCTEIAMDGALDIFGGAASPVANTATYQNVSMITPAPFNAPAVSVVQPKKQHKIAKKIEFSIPMSQEQYQDCLYAYLNKEADKEIARRNAMVKYWSGHINRYYIERTYDNQPSFFNMIALLTGFTNLNSSVKDVEQDLCAIEKRLKGVSHTLNAASIIALRNQNGYFNRLIEILITAKVHKFGHKFDNLKTQEDADYFFTREYPSLSGCLREYIQLIVEDRYRSSQGIRTGEDIVCHVLARIERQE